MPMYLIFTLTISFMFLRNCQGLDAKIVNGTDALPREFPFAVSLRHNNKHTCGATILNKDYVLTAAHCVCEDAKPRNASSYSLQYGLVNITQDNVNVRQISDIHCNNFSMKSLKYDSAVLKLRQSLPSDDNNTWKPVKLAEKFETSTRQSGIIIGWGLISADWEPTNTLQKLNVEVYDDTICTGKYDINHHICFGAAYGGACNGDSGTALLVNDVQVGIASFITAKCGIAHEDSPNIYSRVPTYYKWIRDLAGDIA